MDTAFWILTAITVAGAVLAISLRNLVHCVLSLILFFLGIAGHYFLLRAEFLGVVQILIYIGAVAVLILFAIMLTRNVTGIDGVLPTTLGGTWWIGASLAVLLVGAAWWSLQKDPLLLVLATGQPQAAVAELGRLVVDEAVVPLEVLAVLLTAALVGAVVIALEEVIRRR